MLIVLCFFGRLRIVFDEPGEELCIVDLFAEHFFTASGVKWQLVSFIWISVQANLQKRYKLKISEC